MEKITYADLKKTFPENKKTIESIYGRIVPVRQISYWITIPLLKMNCSAFQASIISLFIAVAACILIAIPNTTCRIVGTYLVPIWHIFDCVDGNIARYRKTASDFGSAVDAICGYFMLAFLPLALGIAAFNIKDNFFNLSPEIFLICGGLASTEDTLMRLIHQKHGFEAQVVEKKTGRYIEKGDNLNELTGIYRIRKLIAVELGLVGVPMFVLLVSPFFNLYHVLAIYYCIYDTLALPLVTGFYLYKCNKGE